MNSPYFSIIVPTYNRAGFIYKTIQSVLVQKFENYEVIVVDDGSTDNTSEIIQTIRDSRVQYYKKRNEERAAARNYGIAKARGEYVNFLDSDDLVLPHHLLTAFNFIQKNKPEVFHLGYKFKDDDTGKERWPKKIVDINDQILRGNLLSCNGVFIRREIALQNRFNQTRVLSSLEDWELWIRLAARFKFMHNPEVTSLVVNHDARSVLSGDTEKIKSKVETFAKIVESDSENQRAFGSHLRQTYASVFTYAALHLAMAHASRKEVFQYLWRGIKLNPAEIFKKRFLVIVKLAMGL